MANLIVNNDFVFNELAFNRNGVIVNSIDLNPWIWNMQGAICVYDIYNNYTLINNALFNPSYFITLTGRIVNFVSMKGAASLSQTINISSTGYYSISFYYIKSINWPFNQIIIKLNSEVIDTLNGSQTFKFHDWVFYSNTFFINDTGSKELKFQGVYTDSIPVIGFTLVNLNYIGEGLYPAPEPTSLENTITNGDFGYPLIESGTFAKLTPTFVLTKWNYMNEVILCEQNCIFNNHQYPSYNQYVLILPNSSLSQNIEFTIPNNYIVTFYTCRCTRAGTTNGCTIKINNLDIGVLNTVLSTEWTYYSFSFTVSTPGIHNLSFETNTGNEFAISNIGMYIPNGNLIQNYDFINPTLNPDSYFYYYQFTENQRIDMQPWSGSGDLSLQNGNNDFNYPSLYNTLNVNVQYVGIQNTAKLVQTINITKTGFYSLSFYYAQRTTSLEGIQLNQLKIYFNSNLINGTLKDSNNWEFYSNTFKIETTGEQELSFEGQNPYPYTEIDPNTAIALVNLNYIGEFHPNQEPKILIGKKDKSNIKKQLYNEITKTLILETQNVKSIKKYIGNSRNTDSSYITKKRGIYSIGMSNI